MAEEFSVIFKSARQSLGSLLAIGCIMSLVALVLISEVTVISDAFGISGNLSTSRYISIVGSLIVQNGNHPTLLG